MLRGKTIRTYLNKLINFFKGLKWPTRYQWGHLFDILTNKEKTVLAVLVLVGIGSAIFCGVKFYYKNTSILPDFGGQYIEGIVGTPRFLNPVLAQTSEVDRDITNLIFSGLIKNRGGQLVADLAKDYAVGENGKIYDFFLKENIFWHDGHRLTAVDVVFTVQTIQNPEYKSPLRLNWQGVEVEKIDDLTVRFRLKNPYGPFLNNLTFGIIAKHIWEGTSPAKFSLSELNLNPVGTGSYKFKKIKKTGDQIEFIELVKNKKYYDSSPYIESIKLFFFDEQKEALAAFNSGKINGLALTSCKEIQKLNPSLNFNKHVFPLPRYFALFFNQDKNKILAEKTIRQALAYSINKEAILQEVLNEKASVVDSAILSFIFGYTPNIDIYDFAPEHAKNILEAAGWQDKDQDGIREKDEQLLEFTLSLPEWPELIETANFIQSSWQELGVLVNLDIREPKIIQKELIKPREYQILLFGEALGIEPDPFAFWHSSQKQDPGLNLALYQNKKVDTLLEEARQELNSDTRAEKLAQFQAMVAEDLPAIFLYSPSFLYAVDKKVKNIKSQLINVPAERFNNIEEWYIKVKREWKK